MNPHAPTDRIDFRQQDISGVVLAGGRGRRMGGRDKGLIEIHGRPMVEYSISRMRPQVASLFVNANRNRAEYEKLCNCLVIEDIVGNFAGPLAGMASAMKAASTSYIAAAPCDSPLLAPDFTRRLYTQLQEADADISVAYGAGRLQPVFALLKCQLLSSMLDFLRNGGSKIDKWYAQHSVTQVDFSDRLEMFLNINTPEEQLELEEKLRH